MSSFATVFEILDSGTEEKKSPPSFSLPKPRIPFRPPGGIRLPILRPNPTRPDPRPQNFANDPRLGKDIANFMNVFRIIHGNSNVSEREQISKSIMSVYTALLDSNALEDDVKEISVKNFTGAIPLMPKICYVQGDEMKLVKTLTFDNFQIDSEDTLRFSITKLVEPLLDFKQQYVDVVKNELKKYLNENVFILYTTPLNELNKVNKKDHTSFSDEMKSIHMYKMGFSFFDMLMNFSRRPEIMNKSEQPLPSETSEDDSMYRDLKDIHDIFHLYLETDEDRLNHLLIDIMKTQKKIENTKKRVTEQRNKVYTFASRDSDYTKNLASERWTLKIVLTLLIIVILMNTFVLTKRNVNINLKTSISVMISSLVLFAFLTNAIHNALSGKQFVAIEGFTTKVNGMGFTDTTYVCPVVLANFIDKFGEVLSREIKQEYFDALHESQEEDLKILSQLEKEHNIKAHFHQLKNNLTHFKINETREYKKLLWYGIVVTCLISILYSASLTKNITQSTWVGISLCTFVAYTTYCLLVVKSIMMRDRQDWDRFNWTMKKFDNMDDNTNRSCESLPGFKN